jgi:hypothetical protein
VFGKKKKKEESMDVIDFVFFRRASPRTLARYWEAERRKAVKIRDEYERTVESKFASVFAGGSGVHHRSKKREDARAGRGPPDSPELFDDPRRGGKELLREKVARDAAAHAKPRFSRV